MFSSVEFLPTALVHCRNNSLVLLWRTSYLHLLYPLVPDKKPSCLLELCAFDTLIVIIYLFPHSRHITGYCNKCNTMDATCGPGTVYSFEAHEFTSAFSGVRVARSLVLGVMFVILSFFVWPLRCLSFYY
jgi:hypothetical protein